MTILLAWLVLMSLFPGWVSAAALRLTWEAPTLNEDGSPLADLAGYDVARCAGSGCVPTMTFVLGQSTTYLDTSLAASTLYRYTVKARDASGNRSEASNVAEEVTADDPPAPDGPQLMAAYAFDEGTGQTVHDASGRLHTGTISGAMWTAGHSQGALRFDGINDAVSIPDDADFDLSTGLTLMAWVHPAVTMQGWRTLIQKEPYAFYLHANSPSNQPAFGLTIGTERWVAAGSRLPRQQWSHVAGTYDGVQMRLYVNGIQVGSRAQTGLVQQTSGVLRVGSNQGQEPFNGRIDDVRLYHGALTASQIQAVLGQPVLITKPTGRTDGTLR